MICLQCGDSFKMLQEIDGKIRNLSARKRCLKCSPWGKHNTSKVGSAKPGEKLECFICHKDYVLNRSKGHNKIRCGSCDVASRRNQMKQRALEYLGGKCIKCGYNKCPAALHFHHRIAQTKSFTIGGAYNRSWESLRRELNKCDILCSNCHAELHFDAGRLGRDISYKEVQKSSILLPATNNY